MALNAAIQNVMWPKAAYWFIINREAYIRYLANTLYSVDLPDFDLGDQEKYWKEISKFFFI